MCSNKKRHHRASHWGTKKREPLFEERTRLARIFYYTSKSSPLYPPFRFSRRNSTRRNQERCSMIKQHRTTDKTIKSRAETFVGCMFDEISWRLWSHLSSSSRCGARALQRKKEESTRTGIGSANAKRLSLNNSLIRVGRQRGRRNSRGLG